MSNIIENVRVFGPVFALVWILTIGGALLRPQRYFNSLLLMFALLVTMLFASGFFSRDAAGYFLLACFLLVMLGLFLVPVLLIANGIVMIRRESFSPAHVLSLALGILVGIGEIAAIVYVLALSETIAIENANLWVLLLVFTVFYFSFLVLSFVVYSVFIQIIPRRRDFDYVIIHGCGLADGERLSRLLTDRVDKAVEVYEKSRNKPVIIPSGGRGEDEKLSEAEAMKNYLLERGIPVEDIITEDASSTTRENLINSKAIISGRPGGQKTALVSSNYHVYRCLCLASEVGLKCTGVGAKVALYYWPSALIREFVAVFTKKRFLIWSLIGWLLFISPLMYLILSGM